MKHRSQGRKLSRERKGRKALLKTLIGSLIQHGRITTTEAKAKEIKPLVERYITLAKHASRNSESKMECVRVLQGHLNTMAVEKIQTKLVDVYKERNGGYARIIKLPSRKSDGSSMAIIELISEEKQSGK